MDSEYVICVLLRDHNIGDEFMSWELHITILPWFSVFDVDDFCKKAAKVVGDKQQAVVTVGEERIWGPNTVNVIEHSRWLQDLHLDILSLVENSGTILVRKRYTGEEYTPHITHQNDTSASVGEKVSITSVYMIRRDSITMQKSVAAVFKCN